MDACGNRYSAGWGYSRPRRDARRSRADPAPGSPSVCAEDRSFGRIRAGVCLKPQANLARPRPKRAPQVPVATAEGADSWGDASMATFFSQKNKLLRRRAQLPAEDRSGTQPAFSVNPPTGVGAQMRATRCLTASSPRAIGIRPPLPTTRTVRTHCFSFNSKKQEHITPIK
jgi:hypothetical protein